MRWPSRLGALGYPIHHLTSAQLGLLVGTVAWGALGSADIGVGVVWGPSAATFSLTRLLADAAAWRRSAWTGLGTNRGGESTGAALGMHGNGLGLVALERERGREFGHLKFEFAWRATALS